MTIDNSKTGVSRDSHNEIERKRRDVQRQKLEELRQVIPALNMERASMVTILVRAKEYIEQLRSRIMELEGLGVGVRSDRVMISPAQRPMLKPHPPPPNNISIEALAQAHQQALQMQMQTPPPPMMDPSGFVNMAPPARSESPLKRMAVQFEEPPVDTLANKEHRLGLRTQPMTASDEERFDPLLNRPTVRRESSLIMPIGRDDRVLFGKRESGLQSFLSTPLPDVLQELCQLEIRCGKCGEGINNLIMIDCDRCQGWFHIRCIGLEFESIPASWACGECRLKAE